MKKFLTLIVLTFCMASAEAFDTGYFMMIGYGSYNDKAGAEVSLGMQLKPVDWLKMDIAPFTGIFRRKNDPNYTRTKEDKQIVCRDNVTGEVTDRSNCGASFDYAFESSLKVQPFEWFEFGAGGRVADRTLVYGVAALKFNPSLSLEAKYGDEYSSLVFRCDF